MSTAVMGLCWPLQMPPTPKSVLMSLADNANDHGECWPSIPTICLRTCLGERTVHGAIKWLEANGVIEADRSNGRHTRYTINTTAKPPQELRPRSTCAPAGAAVVPPQISSKPPQILQQPPQEMRSNQKQQQQQEAKAKEKKRASAPAPEGVEPQTWADWLSLRKAKRAPVTETVIREAAREAEKAGMTLDRFLTVWCARGSQGLEASWLKPHERAGPPLTNPAKPSAAANFRGKTYDATPDDQLPEYLRAAARAAG